MNTTNNINISEKILIICILTLIIFIGLILVNSIPNSPKIIIIKPNRPSFRDAKAKPNKARIFPVRESLGIFFVTAYCPCEICCGEFADGITASGHKIQLGDKFCAADPMIPFGMKLDIPGYGIVKVFDRGGAIKGRKLDVFFDIHREALEWGKQELEIHCWVQGE